MILKRKIYGELIKWKKERKNECLLVAGARQVGKSYIISEFGKKEYKSYIEINFVKQPQLKRIFTFDENTEIEISSEEIFKRLTANIKNANLVSGDTLLFIDEIQKCGAAITALKFLASDKRFDVIASGSLLGLAYGMDDDKEVDKPDSNPVGYVRNIEMHSLDFEEFLWANGYGSETINYLKGFYEEKKKVPEEINSKYEELFREYVVVGGMPEVVVDFITNRNFNSVQATQEKVLSYYYSDISNHAVGSEKIKVRSCYNSIPRQLAKENKKFQYSLVEKGKTARHYSNSIQWLIDSNLVNPCYNVSTPEIPLKAYEMDDSFKVYYHDTGLLCALYGFETKLAILNNTLKGNAKGGIYENVISELLVKKGYKLHYYKTMNSSMEIEFVIERDGSVLPIEVKAGNDTSPSLNSFNRRFSPKCSYKLINGNIGISDNKISIPHYMIMFL